MHSSRLRTVHSSGRLGGGGSGGGFCPGVSAWGCLPRRWDVCLGRVSGVCLGGVCPGGYLPIGGCLSRWYLSRGCLPRESVCPGGVHLPLPCEQNDTQV